MTYGGAELSSLHGSDEWSRFCTAAGRDRVMAVAICVTGADPWRDRITRVALACKESAYILDATQLNEPAQLRSLLEPLLVGPERVAAFHDAKAALRFLLPLGLVPERVFDSMLAEQLLSAGEMTIEPTLEETAQKRLHIDLPAANAHDPAGMLARVRAIYNLRAHLVPLLVNAGLVACARIEFNCAIPTAAMENAGLRLDMARLRFLIAQGAARMTEYTRLFTAAFADSRRDLFGDATLNLHADAQVLQFLQAHGIPVNRVNKSAIKPLIKQYPALQHLLDYRHAAADKALESYVNAVHPITGRVHATYSQLAAATGRFSCSNPNMQSFPRSPQHRACVVPAPGKSLIIADYSQIELRIVAQISRDPRMLAAFRSGGDLHTLTASILTGTPPEQVAKEQRQAAKAVNFGLIYAMGAKGLAAYAEQTYGVEMSLEEAERFRERYFNAYTGVQAWHAQARRDKPAVVRTLSGRMRRVPDGLLAQALNSPVQGTGADILKQALVFLYAALLPLGGQIVGVVHDEVLVEAPQTQARAAAEAVSACMERAAAQFLPDVPCPVDARIAANWSEKG